MQNLVHSSYFKYFIMLAVAGFFMLIPTFLNIVVDRFASTEHYVEFESIEVSDIEYGKWVQDITFKRKVKTNLDGYPEQDLFLYTTDGIQVPVINRARAEEPALYEKTVDNIVKGKRDWSKSIPIEELEKLEIGKCYYWDWIIEFYISEWRYEHSKDIINLKTNRFCITPSTSTPVNLDVDAENVIINPQ